jgi:hypothetical protein
MAWDARFDRPIKVPTGGLIHTPRQAAEHIMALPKSESHKEPWQLAMEILLEAVEGHNPIIFAQIAINRAVVFEPRYAPTKAASPEMKFHHRRKLVRDR